MAVVVGSRVGRGAREPPSVRCEAPTATHTALDLDTAFASAPTSTRNTTLHKMHQ